MKWILILSFQLTGFVAFAQKDPIYNLPSHINEGRYISINGIMQWVTIKGNKTKPVILFLHGGPGSPLSPFSEAVYSGWDKDYILVQWDQRGSARTFGYDAPEELTPAYLKSNFLTTDQMTADGIELSRYILKYLGKDKLILFGTSWGSVLGVKMALKNPELFHAYIAHSQMVNPAGTARLGYQKLLVLAQESNDTIALRQLRAIGMPPYDTARHAGQFMRLIKKYQQKKSISPPSSWFIPAKEYDNEKDELHRNMGDDFSFVNYTGDKRLGISPMSVGIDLLRDELTFNIPVFFIQGENDIQTPVSVNKEYFEKITAPLKKFILLPDTDHGFNQAVIDAHLRIMKEYIPAVRQ